MIDISILIPAYNVEQYIERCVNSIINQKFTGSYEIIIVDDCSTDNTYPKLLELQAKHIEIIKIIKHETNQKLSQARKSAYTLSSGKYIWNVDADDWIEENALQHLFDIATKNDCDIVLFNAQYHDGNTKGESLNKNRQEGLFIDSEIDLLQKYFTGAVWIKFFKRSLIGADFELFKININSGEDYIYCIELYSNANSVYYTNKVLYNYFYNPTSITKTVNHVMLFENLVTLSQALLNIVNKYKSTRDLSFFGENLYASGIRKALLLKILPSKTEKNMSPDVFVTVASTMQRILITTNSNYTINPKNQSYWYIHNKCVEYFGFYSIYRYIAIQKLRTFFNFLKS